MAMTQRTGTRFFATDAGAFLKFALATGIGTYQKDVPLEVYFAAQLMSSTHADCGPCTQLGVGFALQAGLAASAIAGTRLLRAVGRAGGDNDPQRPSGLRVSHRSGHRDARVRGRTRSDHG